MSSKKFWRCTPALLNTLSNVHVELNTQSSKPRIASTLEESGIDI